MQRLALFELDDTLIDRRKAFNVWAAEFGDTHGLEEKWVTWLVFADSHHSGSMRQYFDLVRDEFCLPQTADQLWRQYRQRMPELVTCPAETMDALMALRAAGWRSGIVTNGMIDNQLNKIRNAGLAAMVDAWCISEEVGSRKPDPRIFHIAAQRCGRPADQGGWVIGDSLPRDIDGGHAAGMSTIWLAPRRYLNHANDPEFFTGQAPDATVASVPAAVRVLLDAD